MAEDMIYGILARLPIKSLARFRCVCKLWLKYINDPYLRTIHLKEEPTPILFDHFPPDRIQINILRGVQNDPVMELFFKGSYDYRMHLASFNGLTLVLYELTLVEEDQDPFDAATFGFAVIVPLTKQRHDLPPISMKVRPDLGGPWYAAGIGFDYSTNTLKTVFSIAKDPQFEVLCTMVHSSGTDSWREIAQIPTDPICGEGVYGHGRLHWLSRDGELEIIKIVWFDVKTEEFGLTHPPKPTNFYEDMEQLADLNGEVGFGYASPICIKLWILKQEEEWVLHCCFDPSLVLSRYNSSYVDVLGCWNK
ncbi:putative F-box domain-containing protein [Helianthus annuus]|nr:putative F-box domain-containing protein [Helianthus annuus]